MTPASTSRPPVAAGREPGFGVIPGLAAKFSEAANLELFRKICVNHYFELEAAKAYDAKMIKMPVYLSLGQEGIPAALSSVLASPFIFGQHRAHSYYLSFGGDMNALIDELLHKPTGCAKGMGGSASIHSPKIGMYGHSGLMGDQVPIAVGACLASGKQTLSVVGDASGEEDYVYGALGYAATKKIKFLLVCEDNDLSILTHVSVRRSWSLADVAKSLGMESVDIADDPWTVAHYAKLFAGKPAFINVRTCRQLWHAGTGNDGAPEWNRFDLIKAELGRLGLAEKCARVENDARGLVEKAWQERSRKP